RPGWWDRKARARPDWSGERPPVQLDAVSVDVSELPELETELPDHALRRHVLPIDHRHELTAKRRGSGGKQREARLGRISVPTRPWHQPVAELQPPCALELEPRCAAVPDDPARPPHHE